MTGEIDLLLYSSCVLSNLVLAVCGRSTTELVCLVVLNAVLYNAFDFFIRTSSNWNAATLLYFFKKGIRSCYVNPSSRYLCV